jgi:hypothetical protein
MEWEMIDPIEEVNFHKVTALSDRDIQCGEEPVHG